MQHQGDVHWSLVGAPNGWVEDSLAGSHEVLEWLDREVVPSEVSASFQTSK